MIEELWKNSSFIETEKSLFSIWTRQNKINEFPQLLHSFSES